MKQHYEVQFSSYRPRTECCISQFCNTNCTHSLFRTIEARPGLVAKPLKKFPKSHKRTAGSHFCSASCSECLNEHTRVKLQHNKEFIIFISYLMILSMCNAPINVKPAWGERQGIGWGFAFFSKICNQIPCPRANHSSQMQPNFPTPGCTLLSIPKLPRKAQ